MDEEYCPDEIEIGQYGREKHRPRRYESATVGSIRSELLEGLADEAMGQTGLLDNNPCALTREDALTAYQAAL